jgi:putative nucleotidyltransferase with HDIG domain
MARKTRGARFPGGRPASGDSVHFASFHDRRILVADRETELRESLVGRLALEGYAARGAGEAEAALAALSGTPYDAVLCDLRLRDRDGEPLAPRIREGWPEPGLILLAAPEDAELALASIPDAADDCLRRDRCSEDLPVAVRRALERRRLRRENGELRAALEREMRERARELRRSLRRAGRAYRLALESLVAALDAREGETQRHSKRVAEYSLRLAEVMGLPERQKQKIFHGALLHDLGKIGIPDSVLLKPGPLTAEEWRIMRSHPRVGFGIVRDLPFLRTAAECIVGHHERYDGQGYPLGLGGKRLPLPSRIVAVADALDAMSVQRPYRPAMPYAHIRQELLDNRGTQFDPEVTDAAMHLFHDYGDLHPDARQSLRIAERDPRAGRRVEPNRSSRLAA